MRKVPSWLKTLAGAVIAAAKKISRDNVYAYAGQASFFISISSIPFFMLILSLVRYFIPVSQEQLLGWVGGALPDSVYPFLATLAEELFGKSGIPLISITALVLLWSSASGVRSLCEGVRNVYGTRLKVPYWRKFLLSFLYTFVFLILILGSIVLMFFGEYAFDALKETFSIPEPVMRVLIGLRGVVFLALLAFFFAGMFRALGRAEIPLLHHLPGAVFSSLGWVIFSVGYSVYVGNFADYSYIYGSLTAVILLMLWLYICMTLLLLGAELNGWLYDLFGQKNAQKSL